MRYFFIYFIACFCVIQNHAQAQISFVGEIKPFGFGFVPRGFVACDGQELQVSEYNDLFKAIGKRYGGDGVTTFATPDLNNRVLMGAHKDLPVGTAGGNNTTVKLASGNYLATGRMPTVGITYAICTEGILPTAGGNTATSTIQPPVNTQNEAGKVAIPAPPTPPVTALATTTPTQATWVTLLIPGESLVVLAKKEHARGSFTLQRDGNLVLYDKNNKPMWASATKSLTAKVLTMNPNGSLNILTTNNQSLWSSNTNSNGAYLQIDWNSYTLRVVDMAGKELWRSKK